MNGSERSTGEAPFALHYEGEQEERGEIDARTLSSGLTGLADVVERATVAGIFGRARKPKVAIKAHREGSFEILAALQWTVAHGVEIGAVSTGLGVLINAIGKMVDRFKRAKPVEVGPGLSDDMVLVKWSDGAVTEVTSDEWKFMNDARARRAVKRLVAPMGTAPGAGPTRLRLDSHAASVTVEAEDVEQLDADISDTVETVRTYVTHVTPAVVDFDTSEPWAVYEAGKKRKVRIEDGAFLQRVESGQTKIGKTDMLKVRIRLEQSEVGEKITESRFIEEVLKHEPGATQPTLMEADEQ